MGSQRFCSLILILSAFLNTKAVDFGELPESIIGLSVDKATTTPATTTIHTATHTMKPTTHTSTNSTQAPTSPANTTVHTTAHTTQTTNHTTAIATQAPTSPANTTVHTTAHTTQTTNHTTANSTQAPTKPANTTAHTTANTSVPTNHTTANSTVTPTPQVNTTTTIPGNHTTVPANVTTHTTANGTTHMTVVPTPTYSPKPSPPTTGNYSVSEKGANCIMALFGLQLIIHNTVDTYFNIEPNHTESSGNCGVSSSNLNLTFQEGFIHINFKKDENYYFIDRIQALLAPLSLRQIENQTLMKTKLGTSYKCKSIQTFPLEKDLSLIMVNGKIQAFSIEHNNFGAESECFQDHSSRIYVAVGLTVVIVIILGIILYFIYRSRKLAGYQRI